jgi:hypothetical protein
MIERNLKFWAFTQNCSRSLLASVYKIFHVFFENVAIIMQIYKEDSVESTEEQRVILIVAAVMETDCNEYAIIRVV